jgi:transposase
MSALLAELAAVGATVLFSSHQLELVERFLAQIVQPLVEDRLANRPESLTLDLDMREARTEMVGVTRFDGHPRSGASASEGCPSWRAWGARRSLARAVRSPLSFKAEIVELCQRGDRSIGQVARDFDLTETAVREWVKQAERDAGTRDDGGLTTAERNELAQLRRENRRLREDVEILRRATAFFAKETR